MSTEEIAAARRCRVVILTGVDSPATIECIRRIIGIPGVDVLGVIYDRGVVPLKLRLRRIWNRAKLEGIGSYLTIRGLGFMANVARRIVFPPFDPKPVRCAIFPDELRSVEQLCERHRISHIIVDSLNERDAQMKLSALEADLGVVIGTRILKAGTFKIPRLGSINLHKGQVPRYRGMPPAFWELYHGEKEAGVTVHFVIEKLDAGSIVAEGLVAIGEHETEHSLRIKLDELGARLLVEAVEGIVAGRAVPRPQPAATGRPYTTPTRLERAMLERRLGTLSETATKRLVKQSLYLFLLFGGPVILRNLWLRLRRRTRYTVLLYHRVNDFSKDRLTVSIDRFIHHLAILKHGYPVVSLREAVAAEGYLGPNVVVVTFDDGYSDNADFAALILKHFGLPASFFVAAGLVGTEQPFAHDESSPYSFTNMTWNQVQRLSDNGFEIGSHGWSHLNLGRCSLDEARREIRQSVELLNRNIGVPIKSFAYPFGGREDITLGVISEIIGAGIEIVASAYGGSNYGTIEPHKVLRTAVNDTVDGLTLHALVQGIALATLRDSMASRLPSRIARVLTPISAPRSTS